eukprot:1887145-Rhodomonas_salina.1
MATQTDRGCQSEGARARKRRAAPMQTHQHGTSAQSPGLNAPETRPGSYRSSGTATGCCHTGDRGRRSTSWEPSGRAVIYQIVFDQVSVTLECSHQHHDPPCPVPDGANPHNEHEETRQRHGQETDALSVSCSEVSAPLLDGDGIKGEANSGRADVADHCRVVVQHCLEHSLAVQQYHVLYEQLPVLQQLLLQRFVPLHDLGQEGIDLPQPPPTTLFRTSALKPGRGRRESGAQDLAEDTSGSGVLLAVLAGERGVDALQGRVEGAERGQHVLDLELL